MEVEGHLTTNDSQAKPSTHACDLCGRTFPFLSALTKHMLKHAKDKPVKGSTDAVKLESSLGQTSMEIQEQEEKEGQREEEVKKKEEEVMEGEEEEKEGGVPEEQEGCSSPTESTSACNRVVNGGGGEKDAVKSQRKGPGRKDRSEGNPCPLRQRTLRSQTEQDRGSAVPHEEEAPLACQLCGFKASSKEQLLSHEEKVHLPSDALASGEGSPDEGAPADGDLPPAGEYPCGQCDQVFTQAWFLKSHMKKHQGPLDHGCRICGRRFREPWFLRSHMKTHVIRAKPKAGNPEVPATINGVAQDETALVNDVCLYELCAKCGNFFQDRQSLWLHEQVHERVSGGRRDAEKENEPLPNNTSDSKTPTSKKAFLEFLNLREAGSTEKPPEESQVSRIPELDPISSYQAWQLATRGRVVEASEHSLGWEERLADADVAYDREKGEYVLLKQEKRKKQQLVAPSTSNTPSAAKKKRTSNNGATGAEENEHGSSGDVSPESHSDSEYRPTTTNSRRPSQNKTSECLECGKGFRSQQQMVIHMLIRHGGGSGFGAGMESSAPIFRDAAALSFLTNAAFRDQKPAGQTKDSADKKPSSDRHSAFKHSAGSSSSHQQGSASQSDSSEPGAASLILAGESTEGSSVLDPVKQPDGLVRHRCPFCTHSTLYPEVLWIHQRVAHKVNSSSTLAPKWALRNGFKGPRSTLEFRRRTGPPPFLEGKDCPALTETRKPRTQPPQPQSPAAASGSKTDRTSTSESSPSRSRGHPHKASSSSSTSTSASTPSSKPKTSGSTGSRKRPADASAASNPSGTPKKPSAHAPSPKTSSRAAASSLLPQEGLHFVLASQHGHEDQGKAPAAVAPSTQCRDDSPATAPTSAADSSFQNSSGRAPDTLGGYPGDASQLDVLSFLKNCSPTELAALYHHWGLGTTAMLDQAGVARSLLQQMKYVCPVCGKSFSQPSHYRTHMRSHTGERPFRCRYCPYSASQKGNLKTHVQTVHRVTFDNTSYSEGRLRQEAQPEEDAAAHGPATAQDHLEAEAADSEGLSEGLG
ncbi:zinc finger protein 516 isoform X1 [Alosa sapidissima]|uniref:zinc finger protein 516 isoform X1 n=1 Tax=Alosa sapidissima TaxID=34773 RepID=UPI001C08DBEE|nr:zinc finger protein 516 isoform X1 [Alosa sapidissima]XP_041933173.1 zinc finger protein 516 isoform X1 [Alosa sapidissima]